MAEWQLSDTDASVTEVVRVLRSMSPAGYPTLDLADMRHLLIRKTSRCSVLLNGTKSLVQVWCYNERRRMWRLNHVGFGRGWRVQAAMRASVRRWRSEIDKLGLTQSYTVTPYPNKSRRLTEFVDLMEQQMWELSVESKDPESKTNIYVFDRTNKRANRDEAWLPPRG